MGNAGSWAMPCNPEHVNLFMLCSLCMEWIPYLWVPAHFSWSLNTYLIQAPINHTLQSNLWVCQCNACRPDMQYTWWKGTRVWHYNDCDILMTCTLFCMAQGNSPLSAINCTFTSNNAAYDGGGIFVVVSATNPWWQTSWNQIGQQCQCILILQLYIDFIYALCKWGHTIFEIYVFFSRIESALNGARSAVFTFQSYDINWIYFLISWAWYKSPAIS